MSISRLQNDEETARHEALVASVTKLERDRCLAIVGGMALVAPGPIGALFDAGWQEAVSRISAAIKATPPNGEERPK